jgi:hypothetical protein
MTKALYQYGSHIEAIRRPFSVNKCIRVDILTELLSFVSLGKQGGKYPKTSIDSKTSSEILAKIFKT